jgi:hypothetical protein
VIWTDAEETSNLYKKDATFFPRMNKFERGYVAFESSNYRDHFIRHQNSRLRISKEQTSQLYKDDASFRYIPRTWTPPPPTPGGNFQSKNYPDKYWGVSGSAVKIMNGPHKFEVVMPGNTGEKGTVSFRYTGGNCHECYMRHRNWVISVDEK